MSGMDFRVLQLTISLALFKISTANHCHFYPINGVIHHWRHEGHFPTEEPHVQLRSGHNEDPNHYHSHYGDGWKRTFHKAVYCHQAVFTGHHHHQPNGRHFILVIHDTKGNIWVDVTDGHCGRHDCCGIQQPVYDYCSSNPCVHGTCKSSNMEYTCHCLTNYHGRTCNQYIENCSSHPCVHGTCSNTATGYSCNCSIGYHGKHCDQAINHCSSNPCMHGTCSTTATGYTCTCNTGYHGTYCDKAINHCSPDPCVHGICSNTITGYTCNCNFGFHGPLCDRVINYCSPDPCNGRGTCSNSHTGFRCHCNAGYSGRQCEFDCFPNPCVHGICSNTITGYTCNCNSGFHGPLCDRVINYCSPDPCNGRGTCSNSHTIGFRCHCNAGYSGRQCEFAINQTSTSPPTTSTTIAPTNTRIPACNRLATLTKLAEGKPISAIGSKGCLDGSSSADALVMNLCSAPEMTLWRPGLQVEGNCPSIHTYIPVAQIRHNHLTDVFGVLVKCSLNDRIEVVMQQCGGVPVIHNVTMPNLISYHVITW